MIKLFAALIFISTQIMAQEIAYQKRDMIWDEIQSSQWSTKENSIESVGLTKILKAFSASFLAKTFSDESDYLLNGREKIIHRSGSVALVSLHIFKNSPFSGLLSEGIKPGLIRMSVAAGQSKASFIPGMALKLFIDTEPSANIVVMNSLEGQAPDGNFFAKTFSNKIAPPTSLPLKIGAKLFQNAMDLLTDNGDPTYLPVTNLTKFDVDGEMLVNPETPYQLFFVPRISTSSDIKVDFRDKLAQIPEGTILYDVWAGTIKIGYLKLDSKFLASEFGDRQLFFQHNL